MFYVYFFRFIEFRHLKAQKLKTYLIITNYYRRFIIYYIIFIPYFILFFFLY